MNGTLAPKSEAGPLPRTAVTRGRIILPADPGWGEESERYTGPRIITFNEHFLRIDLFCAISNFA